jgi:hypothetical protein
MTSPPQAADDWPPLPLGEWRATRDTLHLWTQVVGKTKLARAAPLNHWWHVTLQVSPRGLASGAMPAGGERTFEVELDLVDHLLRLRTSDGRASAMPLLPRPVRAFYEEYLLLLGALGIDVRLWPVPVELPHPVPFDRDVEHTEYEPAAARRFWEVLRRADATLRAFASGFLGKQSPVHFFWGSLDLAVTRFSGRRAPAQPQADRVTREAYSHEVVSVGFWPGGETPAGVFVGEPIFYGYAAPPPEGFADAEVRPPPARWDAALGEFVLPYEAVRRTPDPRAAVLAFCESVYEAGATLGGWDRAALERPRADGGAQASWATP